MTQVYIALGSNLDNPLNQVSSAVDEIAVLADSRLLASSPWYESAPVGPGEQANYINGVVGIDTTIPPAQLLTLLQAIEDCHGRVRRERWGPRTLDLDILLYGQQVIDTPTLQVPHPRMEERNFVLYPLADIAPDLIMPTGISIARLLENVVADGIVQLSVGGGRGSIG